MSRQNTNMSADSFFELYSKGCALPNQIDDYIDLWHEKKAGKNLALHEYLGMSKEEFDLWIKDANALPHILNARLKRKST